MASRYRALLIGNSTYPADEHNLQALKGPVKDIAVLNRALADSATGLFEDTDVTLLPEVTSTRAIRAMGRFFGEAGRDDVLLFYFSGHGKLDQAGRLHLCMQDTESTDLLATAVSSARISEFADASHARNVVIVLDCCFSGAFRGGDLGDAVAGPGRYVMTSCRGTQLANDATVENSTSHFTHHLVDGLVGAAADHDGDGYVTFSELYAYVDRRLRDTGKQIPQQRVQGDGELPLARRSQSGLARADAPAPVGQDNAVPALPQPKAATGDVPPGPREPRPGGRWPGRPRRTALLIAAAVAVVAVGGTVAGVLLTQDGQGGNPPAPGGPTVSGAFTYSSPWRLKISGEHVNATEGCTVSVINARSGAEVRNVDKVYGTEIYQVSDTGTFRWQVNDPTCAVVTLPGTGNATLPLVVPPARGDTPVFPVSTKIAVRVTDWSGSSSCDLGLYDPATGVLLDFGTADQTKGDTVALDPGLHKSAYLAIDGCGVHVTAAA